MEGRKDPYQIEFRRMAPLQGYDVGDGTWKVLKGLDKDEYDKLIYENKGLLKIFRVETAKFKLNLFRKLGEFDQKAFASYYSSDEGAYTASRQTSYKGAPSGRQSRSRRRSRSPTFKAECFKCGSSKHASLTCQFAEIGFKAAKAARIFKEREESNEASRTYQPPLPKGRPTSLGPLYRNNSLPPYKTKSNWRARSKSNSTRKDERGFAADTGSDSLSETSDIEEFAGLSWEKRISAKKLASSSIIRQFDDQRMIFIRKSDNMPLIKAKVRNRLYILSKFSKEADRMSFATKSTHHANHDDADASVMLIHPKKLAKHSTTILGKLNFDVASLFLPSMRGYRYFSELIDSWTRKTWTLLFRDRKEAKAKGISIYNTEPYSLYQNGLAERSIKTTEHCIRTALDNAELLVEFWCEAVEAQAYTRAKLRRGLKVVEDVIDEGCKVIAYVPRESLLAKTRKDKLMPSGREGIFIGYDENTTSYYKVYIPEMHSTTISSNVELSDGTFKESDGTYNQHVTRARKGRPRFANLLTVDSVRNKQIKHLPDSVTRVREGLALGTRNHSPDKTINYDLGTPSVLVATPFRVIRSQTKNAALRNKESEGAEGTSLPKSISLITETKLSEDLGDEPKGPTPFRQDHQVAQVTLTKTTGTKRKADKELPNASKTSVQPRQSWNLPGTELDKRASDTFNLGKRYARTSTFQTSLVTRKRKGLLSTEDEKAMMAILDWFDEADNVSGAEEIAMIAHAAKHDILIPITYKEAVEHPIYGKRWKEAIDAEFAALITNHT
ncbi:retrotransposon protein, putative, Ty1-copia sub-class [Drepanopeziza brunnea f. sp. 'multigermtubi' MB_m1]|uniref:Retrotransposon protein, putative, Ty1-copia sub-class n=1 Tax=Marssonina brunnea f. sp. multigermtubi (strain MB_m1) TaxID=1072389 RepID=K1WJY3_MARBU|nr:retrotransposon protein, putative, Ty1-copia sub-class [Drepanopeziza brunnea f. sp. 'multigermtubi' MB_m1]EKD12542.1 retrotransposon protein, putative, Ty1-copia sub-class [Drepanopeziza brunnea f. sp. 'multigermtubi' MB_m1]